MMKRSAIPILILLTSCMLACATGQGTRAGQSEPPGSEVVVATFAGGCFWCVESAFDPVAGVHSAESGYIGGEKPDPTYGEVSAGGSGHLEAVEVRYDPTKISYEELLEIFVGS